MKKIISFIAFFFLAMNIAYAKETVISLSDAHGNLNDTIKVNLNIKDNDEYGLLGVKLDYDETKLEYKDAKINGLKNAFMKDVDEAKGVVTMYALSLDKKRLMNDSGDILEVEFKIISDKNETSNIKVDVTDYAIDENTSLDYTTKDSVITIGNVVTKNSKTSVKDKTTDNNVTYKSSDENIATVDKDGNVTFHEDGDVTITAQKDDEEILKKDYKVDSKLKEEKTSKKKYPWIIGGAFIVLLGGIIGGVLIFRKKHKNGKTKEEKKTI